jgi:glucosylceramidase
VPEKIARREFIGLPKNGGRSHATVAAPLTPESVAPKFDGLAQVWVTDSKNKLARVQDAAWTSASGGASAAATIVLHPGVAHQEMLGFGAALTGGACRVFSKLPADQRSQLFHRLFHPTELGMNVCRTCIGSSDCSEAVYSYDDGEVDPDLTRFSIDKDREYILPMLREARAANPEMFLFASPWSPPGWMKSNGSLLGGCMRHTYMPSYANYFLQYLLAYEAAGVPIQAVTIQNEVDADQDGTMPACAWPQDYEADFLTMHLGPLFQRAGIATKIWIIDHNFNLWGRAIGELETQDVLKFTNAIAWHGYVGDPEMMRRVQKAFPGVEMYFTECGPDFHAPGFDTEWAKWGETFTRIVNSSCKSITAWTLASDERGRPYSGGGDGIGGAMLIDSKSGEITYSGMFWALAHFSKFVRRGAYRIEASGESNRVFHTAFSNPDSSLTVIITNQGPQKPCTIRAGENSLTVPLPADSITTVLSGPPVRS